jgi:hypothetical protein
MVRSPGCGSVAKREPVPEAEAKADGDYKRDAKPEPVVAEADVSSNPDSKHSVSQI